MCRTDWWSKERSWDWGASASRQADSPRQQEQDPAQAALEMAQPRQRQGHATAVESSPPPADSSSWPKAAQRRESRGGIVLVAFNV